MIEVSSEQFETYVAEAMDDIPEKYQRAMSNVVFVIEDAPTEIQRQKMALRHNQTLFGLYEGIPLTKRGAGYNMVLPDKITIFKQPIQYVSETTESLKEQIRHTVWHELAHHFGLDHDRIHSLE